MTWWQYLLLVNLYLVLFYGFYTLFLKGETFFQLNRIYLVASAFLSFIIPLIHSNWVRDLFITQKVEDTLAVYSSPIMVYNFKPIQDNHVTITIGQLVLLIYIIGAIILTGRFIWQLVSLKKIIDQPGPSGAFSFFRSIRLDENSDSQDVIKAHEQVHARELHSADILLIEAISIINWFNPVVYLYRLAIKHIHEFIADREALKMGTNRADYALLLLSQTLRTPTHQLVTPFFNHSLLKRRIIMLQKNRSHRTALLKYGLSAPLFILMLVLSSATISKSRTVKFLNIKAENVFLTPAPTLDSVANNTSKEIQIKVENNQWQNKNLQELTIAADTTPTKKENGPIFTVAEKNPEFKGGITAFYQFLSQNIRYPEAMRKNKIQGKEFITFVVEKDGSLSGIKALIDLGYGAAEESIRVLSISPKWSAGIQNGRLVRVQYTVPINFTLEDGKAVKDTTQKTGQVPVKEYKTGDNAGSYYKASTDTDNKNTLILSSGLLSQFKPLYLLDGKEIPDLEVINPNDIESVSVLKSDAKNNLVVLYGQKAINGVVLIETKKAAKKTTIKLH